MQVKTTPGAFSAALGIAGTGLALWLPDQRWIGEALVMVAILIFIFGIRIDGWNVRARPPWRTFQVIPTGGNTPIWKAVTHIRNAINDTDHGDCYPTTLKAIRQAALDGKIVLRGRHEVDVGSSQAYSDVATDIPRAYWEKSTIGPLATDERHHGSWPHTNPETAFAWGVNGIKEKNRYAELTVNIRDIRRIWPLAE